MSPFSMLWRFWAGLALGVLFYTGLRLTVARLPVSTHPVSLTLFSFWIRTIAVVGAFFFLIREHWEYAVISLAGFSAGRLAVVKFLTRQGASTKCT